jgi:hypothetical protein
MPQAYVEMNRDDAARLGVATARPCGGVTAPRHDRAPRVDRRPRNAARRASLFVPFFDERLLINR